jgi:hypothetical protein
MGLDTGALGPRICDRSSRRHPGMGARVSIDRTACLSDLVRQCPLSASRGETRCDTYRNRHPCRCGAEHSHLETSARRLTRKRTPLDPSRRPSSSRQPHHICILALKAERSECLYEHWRRVRSSPRMVSSAEGKRSLESTIGEDQHAGEADPFRLPRRRRRATVPSLSARSGSSPRRRNRLPESHRRTRQSDSVPASRLPRSGMFAATGTRKLPTIKLPDGRIISHSKAILAWVHEQTEQGEATKQAA